MRRTQSTAEATVTLVIDSRDDVGPDAGGDPRIGRAGAGLVPADTSIRPAEELVAQEA